MKKKIIFLFLLFISHNALAFLKPWEKNPMTFDKFCEMLEEEEKEFYARKNLKPKTLPAVDVIPQYTINTAMQSFNDFFQNYKYLCAIGTTFFVICYYHYKLLRAKSCINNPETWTDFKKTLPMDVFYEIPKENISEELLDAINRYYIADNQCFPQSTEPICLFLKEVEREIRQLENFVNLYRYLSLPLISVLFPNYEEELLLAEEKIEKLHYMHELVSEKLIAMKS